MTLCVPTQALHITSGVIGLQNGHWAVLASEFSIYEVVVEAVFRGKRPFGSMSAFQHRLNKIGINFFLFVKNNRFFSIRYLYFEVIHGNSLFQQSKHLTQHTNNHPNIYVLG
jgi:hypothetical protein